ncbi:TetR/AcrR family transcriptional regulator [Sphingomonas canadensis]|uniref:TetR/AcrR family transcriptional regulator n=1 Tax=Sphingomonas canadensis TaxID=1219257 RepID=A0ABW3H4A6_9SPHN|nr:helix-turn-helix domain-containing protein [Sphingomonas canadensis]MCW3835866.1 TetR/AcrR family transcriptional regulator [Sphingomonas canadensis]
MSITRRRLSPEESRDAALEAARTLLIEDGPQSVTLKAVAARIGRTHANLLHHFGSAAGLQKALVASLAEEVTARIGEAILRARESDHDPREVVDLTFDAFDKGGAGALATWMLLSGNNDVLDPILEAIQRLVDQIGRDHPHKDQSLQEETLHLVLMALGDALLGAPMARTLGLPRRTARDLAARALAQAHLHPEPPAS